MTIEEQIEESRRKLRERRPPPPPNRDQLNTLAVSRIDDSLPEPLREFTIYAGQTPDTTEADKWTPYFFKVEAPGLAPIAFATVAIKDSVLVKVSSIYVGATKFGADWDAAIVAAAPPEGTKGR